VKVRVLACAEREFVDAVDRDNAERPGLGYEFAEEVRSAFERIGAFPDAWPLFSARSRRCIVSRFPYGVLDQNRAERILASPSCT
jgi:hypothetical protein